MDSRSTLRPYRDPAVVSGSALVAAAVLWLAFWRLGLDKYPVIRGLGEAAVPLALASGIILVLAAAAVLIHVSLAPPSGFLTTEEPLLSPPTAPTIHRRVPFIVVLGVTPQAGATTLAWGLALLIATHGRVGNDGRRPRPVCLFRDEDVPEGVAIDAHALDSYLRNHPADVDEDILDLASRHREGIEVLSIGGKRPNAVQMDQLLPVLRQHYDAVIMDIPADGRWLASMSVGLADAVFLMWAPRERAGDLQVWLDRLWGLGLEGKTILTVGRRRASDRPLSRRLFQFVLELPDDAAVSAGAPDGGGGAWALGNSIAGRQMRRAAERLLPDLFSKDRGGDDGA